MRPGRAGQAGFITVGGLVCLAVTAGAVVTLIGSSESGSGTAAKLFDLGARAGVARQLGLVRALGAGAAAAVGGAVGLTIGMRSDDPAVSR